MDCFAQKKENSKKKQEIKSKKNLKSQQKYTILLVSVVQSKIN